MTKRSKWSLVVGVGLALIALALMFRWKFDSAREVQPVVDARVLMGTTWQIQALPAPGNSPSEAREAVSSAYAELARIEELMSEWKPESPISQLNSTAGTEGIAVPTELRQIVERGIRYGELTGGAFDITWRGLGSVWQLDQNFQVPTSEQVERAKRLVDFRAIRVRGDRVALPEGFSLGLGGIAKGYAIDRAAETLRQAGLTNFLINGGGDILISGSRVQRPWSIGIQAPRGKRSDLLARIRLSGKGAVVTSGDYERFQIVDGVRYHHIIDPRTGYPAVACQAVTVVAETAEKADVLSTGIFVLGPDEGMDLAAALEVEVLIIDSHGRYRMTEGFHKIAEFTEAP